MIRLFIFPVLMVLSVGLADDANRRDRTPNSAETIRRGDAAQLQVRAGETLNSVKPLKEKGENLSVPAVETVPDKTDSSADPAPAN